MLLLQLITFASAMPFLTPARIGWLGRSDEDVLVSGDGVLSRYTRTGEVVFSVPCQSAKAQIRQVVLCRSKDGLRGVTAGDGSVVWEWSAPGTIKELLIEEGIAALTYATDTKDTARASNSGVLLDVPTGKPIRSFSVPAGAALRAVFKIDADIALIFHVSKQRGESDVMAIRLERAAERELWTAPGAAAYGAGMSSGVLVLKGNAMEARRPATGELLWRDGSIDAEIGARLLLVEEHEADGRITWNALDPATRLRVWRGHCDGVHPDRLKAESDEFMILGAVSGGWCILRNADGAMMGWRSEGLDAALIDGEGSIIGEIADSGGRVFVSPPTHVVQAPAGRVGEPDGSVPDWWRTGTQLRYRTSSRPFAASLVAPVLRELYRDGYEELTAVLSNGAVVWPGPPPVDVGAAAALITGADGSVSPGGWRVGPPTWAMITIQDLAHKCPDPHCGTIVPTKLPVVLLQTSNGQRVWVLRSAVAPIVVGWSGPLGSGWLTDIFPGGRREEGDGK